MVATIAILASLMATAGAQAATSVPLGTADSFAILAGSTITNTGASTITGDIGLCCTGVAMTGFGTLIQLQGAQYAGTGTPAETAQNDLDTAYFNAAAQPVTRTVPVDLSLSGTPAAPLLPGVYQSSSRGALAINTGLTLDFQGNPNAVFIFQGTALTTAAGPAGSVTVVNAGGVPNGCNIFWQLSDTATSVALGASSAFLGTTMSLGASALGTGATVQGRILTRRSKAVTLQANTISRPTCTALAPASSVGPSAAPAAPAGPAASAPPAAVAPPVAAPPVAALPADALPAAALPADAPAADAAPAAALPAPAAAPAAAPTVRGSAVLTPRTPGLSAARCRTGFRATVRGTMIRRVVFSIAGRRIASRPGPLFQVHVRPAVGRRGILRARVTFKDATRARTLTFAYRGCASAVLHPARGPSRFTG